MTLLLSNAIVNVDHADCIYVDNSGYLHIDVSAGTLFIKNIPDNAMQQIAVALTENKRFIEFEDAALVITEEDNNDIGSDIE